MKIALILVALGIIVVVFLSLRRSEPAPAAGAPAAATSSSGPAALVDGIQTQIDFRTKAAVVTKIESERNALKQLLAMPDADADRVRDQLASETALEGEVAQARDQLIASGQTQASVTKWLSANHWDEVRELAKQLRDRPKDQP